MSYRDPEKAAEELAVFRAFLSAHPSLATEVEEVIQPGEPFPDITVRLRSGSEMDFELGEWLDARQMQRAKGIEQLESGLMDALGEQGPNESDHFRCVMLTLRDDAGRFNPHDAAAFRSELFGLIAETDRRWRSERYWHSPQGCVFRHFGPYPALGTYLRSIHFWPLRCGNTVEKRWPDGQPWIFFEAWGGSYSPDVALRALSEIVQKKQTHYGGLGGRLVCLLIYYAQAVRYNTPYYGIETRGFEDVATVAARSLKGGRLVFEKVYLFQALEPDLQAFEVYPNLMRCQ